MPVPYSRKLTSGSGQVLGDVHMDIIGYTKFEKVTAGFQLDCQRR